MPVKKTLVKRAAKKTAAKKTSAKTFTKKPSQKATARKPRRKSVIGNWDVFQAGIHARPGSSVTKWPTLVTPASPARPVMTATRAPLTTPAPTVCVSEY